MTVQDVNTNPNRAGEITKPTESLSYVLTPFQSLMWLEGEIHPGVPVTNMVTRLDIDTEVDVPAFQTAFLSLSKHYDAMRAVVSKARGAPVLQISSQLDHSLAFHDFSSVDDPEGAYSSRSQEVLNKTFSYNQRLYDAALVKLSDGRFIFFMSQHHLVTDGRSLTLWLEALDKHYSAIVNGNEASEEKVPCSFIDYLQNRHDYFSSDSAKESEAYWAERYSTPVEAVSFYGRSCERKTALSKRLQVRLPAEVSCKILDLKPNVSPSFVFTTVLFAYLKRVTSNSDLCIGVPLLNRTEEYMESVGLFMEVCPNRIHVEEGDSFADLLRKVREEITSVKPHRSHTVTTRNAKYEVLLNYRLPADPQFDGKPVALKRCSALNLLERVQLGESDFHDWSRRDSLTVDITHIPSREEFTVSFDFNLGVWPDEVCRQRSADHFICLMEHFLDHRDHVIDEVDLLTPDENKLLFPEERSALLRGEKVPNVVELFDRQVAQHYTKPAIEYEDSVLTYGELSSRINALAAKLRSMGVMPGVLVAVCLHRSPAVVITLLAIIRAGGAYVPIDPDYPEKRIKTIVEDAKPAVFLTEKTLYKKVASYHQGEVFCVDSQEFQSPVEDSRGTDLIVGDLAYVIFTSGSTGRPKGVQVTNHGLGTFLLAMASKPGLIAEDRLLAVTTISFDTSALELFLPLIVGATIRIVPHETAINGRALSSVIEGAGITVLQATPATFRMLIAGGWQYTHKLRVLCGGETLQDDLAQEILTRCDALWNMYGPTETTIWSSVKRIINDTDSVTIGNPIAGTQMYILNNSMQPVPVGVEGELYIAGDGVAHGYLGRPDLTAERFPENPFSKIPNARMYRTGDRVRILEEMEFEYLGRTDFQVKVRGFRVELGEIESVLGQHEGVRECVVIARPDKSGEMILVAYIIPVDPGKHTDRMQLQIFVRDRLPVYMTPVAFVVLEELPLTPNGKVDRNALPSPAESTAIHESYVEPRNDFELALASVWERQLNVSPIGITDNFFDIGGHSLLAMVVTDAMEKATGVKFDLGLLFLFPTIEKLVKALDDGIEKQSSNIVVLQSSGNRTPLFCLCGIELYRELAIALGDEQSVYGIYVPEEQALLENSIAGAKSNVEIDHLVERYCDAIQRQQETGPYQLAGVSFGGVLAIETARLLRQRGEEVDSVFLLDTTLRRGKKKKWIIFLFVTVPKKILQKALKLFDRFSKVQAKDETLTNDTDPSDKFNAAVDARQAVFLQAMEFYETKQTPYPGDIVLLKAMDKSGYGPHIHFLHDYGWGGLVAGKVAIHEVPGDHLGILKSGNVRSVANEILKYLE
ncbi:MAG: amino acid adenylation domain-containing protein [Candidatus Sedimenticola sp. (ex Thyasira tokunagai)]